MPDLDVVIVGAGITGLSAAYELGLHGLTARVLDARQRPGGVILTERCGGFVIDAGPDSLLVQKPAAVGLCRELGLGDRLLPMKPPRTAYIYRAGRLHAIPPASILGFPTRLWPLVRSGLFSPAGKLRMAREVFLPPRAAAGDESIAAFVGRHFGREAVEYVAEPLLAGIHAGDVDRLSIRAAFPRLVEAEAERGSIVRAFAARRSGGEGAFNSLPGGIGELADALVSRLPPDALRCGGHVERIELDPVVRVHQQGHPPLTARAVMLAVPGWAAEPLVRPLDAVLADLCGGIPYWSTAMVALAYPREAVAHRLAGSGFVVPRKEGLTITAGSFVSSKWPGRAPDGQALLRAFLGGARDPDAVDRSDADLIGAATRDLGGILGLTGAPTLTRVYRWRRASPQQEVGHLARMVRLDERLASLPRLFLSGTGLRGVGIPDCIADGRSTAAAIVAQLAHTPRRRGEGEPGGGGRA